MAAAALPRQNLSIIPYVVEPEFDLRRLLPLMQHPSHPISDTFGHHIKPRDALLDSFDSCVAAALDHDVQSLHNHIMQNVPLALAPVAQTRCVHTSLPNIKCCGILLHGLLPRLSFFAAQERFVQRALADCALTVARIPWHPPCTVGTTTGIVG